MRRAQVSSFARLGSGNGLMASSYRSLASVNPSFTTARSTSYIWGRRWYGAAAHTEEEKPYVGPDWDGVPPLRTRLRVYSREEVATHNSPEDCWVIINGRIYDVTLWADLHPGGRNILYQHAGKDATDAWARATHGNRARYLMERHVVGKVDTPARFTGGGKAAVDMDYDTQTFGDPDDSDDKYFLEDMSKWRESNITE